MSVPQHASGVLAGVFALAVGVIIGHVLTQSTVGRAPWYEATVHVPDHKEGTDPTGPHQILTWSPPGMRYMIPESESGTIILISSPFSLSL